MAAVTLAEDASTPAAASALAFALTSFAAAWDAVAEVALPSGTRLTTLRPGRAVGPLVPATLAILAALLSTPFLPSLDGAILVLEDVHEAAHRIDRYLTQLEHAHLLCRLGGLVFGSFTDGEDSEWLPSIFAEFAAKIPGPVVCGLPFGHQFPSISLPVGRLARLEATADHVRLGWE